LKFKTFIQYVEEAYNKFEEVMVNTIDEHAPMKKRKSISQPAPFMNKTLRSAVYKKRMTHNKLLSSKIISLVILLPLLVKNGLIVG
jgi:hypothetical protein